MCSLSDRLISSEISCDYRLLWEGVLGLSLRFMFIKSTRFISINCTEEQKKFRNRRHQDAWRSFMKDTKQAGKDIIR